jgi:hypothetical protein
MAIQCSTIGREFASVSTRQIDRWVVDRHTPLFLRHCHVCYTQLARRDEMSPSGEQRGRGRRKEKEEEEGKGKGRQGKRNPGPLTVASAI